MNNLNEHSASDEARGQEEPGEVGVYDFTYVSTTARIAQYDDLRSAPRITEIQPAETAAYIENLASKIYEQAKVAGGKIPYTVIREVSENFIHARFKEIVVSILDEGNTIRFADQGPGISNKEKARMPGFSSAIEPMKGYIRGVGSGLPIVSEYLDFSHGSITIEDNLGAGSVVTISMVGKRENPGDSGREHDRENRASAGYRYNEEQPAYGRMRFSDGQMAPAYHDAANPNNVERRRARARAARVASITPHLSARERDFLLIILDEGELGVTELSRLTDAPMSSTHAALKKLEEAGLVEKMGSSKRGLTDLGYEVAQSL